MEGERNVLRDRFNTLAGAAAFSQQLLENRAAVSAVVCQDPTCWLVVR